MFAQYLRLTDYMSYRLVSHITGLLTWKEIMGITPQLADSGSTRVPAV